MSEITLTVTSKVLAHATPERIMERQIAYRLPSPDIAEILAEINTRQRVTLGIGGFVVLDVGDTGAIWRAHNAYRLEDFDSLFAFLATRPDKPMRFLCEVLS